MKYTIAIHVPVKDGPALDTVEIAVDDEFPIPRVGETVIFDGDGDGVTAVVDEVTHWIVTSGSPRSLTVRVTADDWSAKVLQGILRFGDINAWIAQFSNPTGDDDE